MAQAYFETAKLTWPQFVAISRFVKERYGLHLHHNKMSLVQSRLQKRLRVLNLDSFRQYVDLIGADNNGAETAMMIDALSTNVTSFFREPRHFTFLEKSLLPQICEQRERQRRVRIWSAGCSSGEEPYSLAMSAMRAVNDPGDWDLRVLATDVSRRVLAIAKQGTYRREQLQRISEPMIRHFFDCRKDAAGVHYQVKTPLRRLVEFAYLNLMASWPMKGSFDIVFCRNVMIYFDKPTQERLVERFHDILAPGGTLFIGHSESLTGVQHRFSYVAPAIYQKGPIA